MNRFSCFFWALPGRAIHIEAADVSDAQVSRLIEHERREVNLERFTFNVVEVDENGRPA